jgi:hypothetical protein
MAAFQFQSDEDHVADKPRDRRERRWFRGGPDDPRSTNRRVRGKQASGIEYSRTQQGVLHSDKRTITKRRRSIDSHTLGGQ